MQVKKITKITRKPAPDKVYNIKTKNHNYFAGGVLVHNCDDPNNPIDAESEQVRKTTERKFRDYIIGRRNNPKTTRLLTIQQRCHYDDISGYIRREMSDFEILIVPAIADTDKYFTFPRSGDEYVLPAKTYIQPERYGEKEDKEAKKVLGTFMYASRFLQDPMVEGGNVINPDWIRNLTRLPDEFKFVISVDASFGSQTATASNVAIQAWAIAKPNFYLWDEDVDKYTFWQTIEHIKKNLAKWSIELGAPCTEILIENKANGPAVVETLRKTFTGVNAVEPKGSKIARAEAIAPTVEAGNVYARRLEEFWNDFEIELAAFPEGDRDDRVDALSQLMWKYIQRWRSRQPRITAKSISNVFYNQR